MRQDFSKNWSRSWATGAGEGAQPHFYIPFAATPRCATVRFERTGFRPSYDGQMGYFPLRYRLEGRERYLIWIGDEQDSIVVEPNGAIPNFSDALLVRQYAEPRQLTRETEEPVLHNLDWVQSWCSDGKDPIDCAEALNAWNLFADVAASVGAAGIDFRAIDRCAPATYQKLFWGSNLPAVTRRENTTFRSGPLKISEA
ncbi:MAG: hypothetical protein WBW33_33020 [Bryobacteraceae bacterium]